MIVKADFSTYLHRLVELCPQIGVHDAIPSLVAVALVDVMVNARILLQVPRFSLLVRRPREHEIKDVKVALALRRVH